MLVELDRTKEEALEKALENYSNYEIVWADATEVDFTQFNLEGKQVKVIGSLPYNVGKRIIYNLLNSNLNWESAAFFLQKEVAESYTSKAPQADFLAVSVSIYADMEVRFQVSPKSFYPIPNVDSSAVLLKRHDRYNHLDKQKLSKLIKSGFGAPRKNILNNLKSLNFTGEDIESAGLTVNLRPAQLKLDDWIKLFQYKKLI